MRHVAPPTLIPAHSGKIMKLSKTLLVAFALTICGGQGFAQTFPTGPITIYVGTAPGGTMDSIARVLAMDFEKKWGQPVVVDSRVGSGSMLATSLVARSAQDGRN